MFAKEATKAMSEEDAERIREQWKKYKTLKEVLDKAFLRASEGKGRERHAENNPFEEQPICTELESLGLSPAVYQVRKKAKESLRLPAREARNEWLDIIVYAAAAYVALTVGEAKVKSTYYGDIQE